MNNDDKAFILDPDKWPMWPLLPLKREHNGQRQCGFITAGFTTMWLGYVFGLDRIPGDSLGEKFGPDKRIEYTSVDAILADGWEVD